MYVKTCFCHQEPTSAVPLPAALDEQHNALFEPLRCCFPTQNLQNSMKMEGVENACKNRCKILYFVMCLKLLASTRAAARASISRFRPFQKSTENVLNFDPKIDHKSMKILSRVGPEIISEKVLQTNAKKSGQRSQNRAQGCQSGPQNPSKILPKRSPVDQKRVQKGNQVPKWAPRGPRGPKMT